MPTRIQMQRLTNLVVEVEALERKLALEVIRMSTERELTSLLKRVALELKEQQINLVKSEELTQEKTEEKQSMGLTSKSPPFARRAKGGAPARSGGALP